MPKPTPGPWQLDPADPLSVVADVDGTRWEVGYAVRNCGANDTGDMPPDDGESRANARVLAASWEMLAELERLADDARLKLGPVVRDRVLTLIAKAKGE